VQAREQALIKGGRGAVQSPVIFQLCFGNPWRQRAPSLCGQHSLQSFASSLRSSAQCYEISGRDCSPGCPSLQEWQWLGFWLQQAKVGKNRLLQPTYCNQGKNKTSSTCNSFYDRLRVHLKQRNAQSLGNGSDLCAALC